VTTQANSKSSLPAQSPSPRGMSAPLTGGVRRVGTIILIILILLTHKISHSSVNDKTLITDHFVINFNTQASAYAIAIATRLEAYNHIICSFFEMDFLERVNVYVYYNKSSSNADNIYLSSDTNFFDTEIKIYEELFFIYLARLMHGGGLTKINKNFIEALLSYPMVEQSQNYLKLILNDLLNISLISSVDIENLGAYSDAVQREIYTVFTHYVISNYGKKILIQSLKDTKYYNGFFRSLSSITGESINKISDGFNLFLRKSREDISDIKNTGRLVIGMDDGFSDVSFSIIDENRVVILQQYKDDYRFVLIEMGMKKVIYLKLSGKGSCFNNIVSLDNNLIAITEIMKNGSKIHLFDITAHNFTDNFFLPLVFIRDINSANNEIIVFSAYCGLTNDIYSFNIKNREFKVINGSGYNNHPVTIGNKIYYISLYKGVNRLFVDCLNCDL